MLTRRALGALAALPVAGCYAHAPLNLDAAPAGARVEVALTARGTEEVARLLGPNVARVEGELARVTPDSLVLAVVRTERAGGVDDLWQRQRVALARPLVAAAHRRRLRRGRTWLAAAAALLGAAALGTGFLGGRSPLGGAGASVDTPG